MTDKSVCTSCRHASHSTTCVHPTHNGSGANFTCGCDVRPPWQQTAPLVTFVRPTTKAEARQRYRDLVDLVSDYDFQAREIRGAGGNGIVAREKRGPEREARRLAIAHKRDIALDEMRRLKDWIKAFVERHNEINVREHPFSIMLRVRDALIAGSLNDEARAAFVAELTAAVPLPKVRQWEASDRKPWTSRATMEMVATYLEEDDDDENG